MEKKCKHICCGDTCHREPPKPKARQPLRRSVIKRKAATIKEQDKGLQLWFEERRIEMTGMCVCGCGKNSSKHEDNNYKSSICHILCKKLFKSIATHPLNWVELNFWEGHHTTFDNMGYEHCKRTKSELWEIVLTKFKLLYPHIHQNEHKFIPQILLDSLIHNVKNGS